MAKHGIEAFVGYVPESIDVVGQPREPPRQGWRHHVDLSRRLENGAYPSGQLVNVSDSGVGDEQEPLNWQLRTSLGRSAFVNIDAPRGWRAAYRG
jgi:hypothetical protein